MRAATATARATLEAALPPVEARLGAWADGEAAAAWAAAASTLDPRDEATAAQLEARRGLHESASEQLGSARSALKARVRIGARTVRALAEA